MYRVTLRRICVLRRSTPTAAIRMMLDMGALNFDIKSCAVPGEHTDILQLLSKGAGAEIYNSKSVSKRKYRIWKTGKGIEPLDMKT